MSASFSITELMHVVLGPIPPVSSSLGVSESTVSITGADGYEPSLLHAMDSPFVAPTCFYIDDIFFGHSSFEIAFCFLRDHLLLRIEWSMLKLSFEELVLFTDGIEALGLTYLAGGRVRIKHACSERIRNWPVPLLVQMFGHL